MAELEKVARCGPWEQRPQREARPEGRYRSFETEVGSATIAGEQLDEGDGMTRVYVDQTHIKSGRLALDIALIFAVLSGSFWPIVLLLIWGWRWAKSKLFLPPVRGFEVIMKERA